MAFVYIAGPYTKGDVVVNVQAAVKAAEELVKAGHVPYVPHLTHLWHLIEPHPPQFWYDYDFHWLRRCDCLIRLPGKSTGADNEMVVAKELCMPIYRSVKRCISKEST